MVKATVFLLIMYSGNASFPGQDQRTVSVKLPMSSMQACLNAKYEVTRLDYSGRPVKWAKCVNTSTGETY